MITSIMCTHKIVFNSVIVRTVGATGFFKLAMTGASKCHTSTTVDNSHSSISYTRLKYNFQEFRATPSIGKIDTISMHNMRYM